jgi:hypothetical protein
MLLIELLHERRTCSFLLKVITTCCSSSVRVAPYAVVVRLLHRSYVHVPCYLLLYLFVHCFAKLSCCPTRWRRGHGKDREHSPRSRCQMTTLISIIILVGGLTTFIPRRLVQPLLKRSQPPLLPLCPTTLLGQSLRKPHPCGSQ